MTADEIILFIKWIMLFGAAFTSGAFLFSFSYFQIKGRNRQDAGAQFSTRRGNVPRIPEIFEGPAGSFEGSLVGNSNAEANPGSAPYSAVSPQKREARFAVLNEPVLNTDGAGRRNKAGWK